MARRRGARAVPGGDADRERRNLGFAAATTSAYALRSSGAPTGWCCVNNDATVAPDVVRELDAAARVRGRGRASSAARCSSPTRPIASGSPGSASTAALGYSGRPRGYRKRDGPRYAQIEAVDRAVGACMAVSRERVDAVGLLDEELFAYVEDVDWSLRVREAGFEVLFVPKARAWHRVARLDRRRGGVDARRSTTACATRSSSASATGRCPAGLRELRRYGRRSGTFGARAVRSRTRAAAAPRPAQPRASEGARDARRGRLGAAGDATAAHTTIAGNAHAGSSHGASRSRTPGRPRRRPA